MSNIVGMVSFYQKEGVSKQEFLQAHEKYNSSFVSKQKGCMSHKLLVDGDKWTDLVTWENMEDVESTFKEVQTNPLAAEIMPFIDQIGNDDDIPFYSVAKNYSDKGQTTASNAIWFISYKLTKKASVQEFLLASEKTHDEVLSKKEGFISWVVLVDDDIWVDLVTWDTMENAIKAEKHDGKPDPVARKFYSFINPNSLKMQSFTVVRNY